MHRFISPILAIRNFNIIEIAVSHKERKYGKSNYGFSRLVPVLVDGFIFTLLMVSQNQKIYFR